MIWRDELNPVKNWQGWLGCLVILALFALVGGIERSFPPRVDVEIVQAQRVLP